MSGDEPNSGAQVAQQRKQYVIGLLLLFVVVLEWTGSNFLTQDLFEDGYNKPFFVTYMNTASFSLYLVPVLIKHILWEGSTVKREPTYSRQGYQALVDDDDSQIDDDCPPDLGPSNSLGHQPLTVSETAKLASIFCVFWFAANWTVNASLSFTSVASTTILSSMSGFFTLLIGRALRVESLSLGKIGAVVVRFVFPFVSVQFHSNVLDSFAGSVLVSLADNSGAPREPVEEIPGFSPGHSHPQAIFGDFLALGSALFYALYVVLLKARIGDESRINMQLFFGFVGIFNILGFWPIGVLLHYAKIEVFELPSSKKALRAVLLNMFITLSSDYIYVLAMLKTTPLVVTIGLSLTIPLAKIEKRHLAIDLFILTLKEEDRAKGLTDLVKSHYAINQKTTKASESRLKQYLRLDGNKQGEQGVNLVELSLAGREQLVIKKKDTQGESVFTFDGSTTLSTALIALTSWTWPEPFKWIQDRASILVLELSRGPGSLWNEIVDSPPSSQDHPEYEWEAEVRLGDELCMAERAFLRNRKRKMRTAFAELFGVAFHEIDERDLPIVAIAGSGGGFRAMVNTTGALKGAQDTGIFDCISYIAGISGSCWALAMMYSGVTGSPSPSEAQKHMRSRIQTPYLDISNFDIIISPPFNKYLLSGLLHKVTAPGWGNISLTDIYGTLLSTRLLVPDDIKKLDPRCLSLHQFRRFIDDGSYPMPIMTAISRHLRQDLENKEVETKKKERRSYAPTRRLKLRREAEELEAKARWLWFEWSPYEVGCDELGGCLDTILGAGTSIRACQKPEISLTLLSGIFGSAFCASLQHFDLAQYFLEVRPLLRDLPLPIFNWLDNVLVENEKEFDVIHPVSPTGLPNFVKGLEDQLRYGSPDSITEAETLRFMDAGAELNIPYYPLLRRGVDCIIALDASADSQDLWFTRAEEYAARRGLQTWPKGARWPKVLQPAAESSDTPAQNQVSDSDSRTNQEIASTKESDVVEQADHQKAAEAPMGNAPLATEDTAPDHDKGQDTTVPVTKDRDIGSLRKLTNTLNQPDEETKPLSAYVWIGSSTDNGSSRVDNLEEEALASRDGIGIVYMPLIPNEEAQRRYGGGLWHPLDVSTWRFELQCEETDKLLTTAEMNFKDGHQKIARVLKVMWMRKRNARLEKEHQKWKHDFDRLVDSTS
ncbi:unnamed protein product [Rhizoctonia solani]|nr:unnamed protein product [Rhizoctonia solani]